ncbi:MAG: glucosamine-6-phosphate deaminase, partial [Dehalococcoidia bacterium]
MRIQIEPDEHAVAVCAAGVICDVVRDDPGATLGLPTGATPICTYAELDRRVAAGAAGFSRATAFAVDEFVTGDSRPRLSRDTPGTNATFFARYLRVRFSQLRCPDASAADPDAEIRSFAGDIRRAGGLDLCVLGIGVNGHIAFNEPGAAVDSRARAVELEPASRAAHAEGFGSLDLVPHTGMTLGIADLLESRRILVIAQGHAKAAIVRAAIRGAFGAA